MANVDFLAQLADYLDNEGIGNSGVTSASNVNIFVGHYPNDPDNCIALLGLIGQTKPDVYIAGFEYPRFQVIVRNTNYNTGAGKLRAIRNALHDKLNVTTSNFIALYIQAEQDGFPLGEDGSGRFEFSINFSAQIRNDDSGS